MFTRCVIVVSVELYMDMVMCRKYYIHGYSLCFSVCCVSGEDLAAHVLLMWSLIPTVPSLDWPYKSWLLRHLPVPGTESV